MPDEPGGRGVAAGGRVEDLATPLDIWLYFLRHAQELDANALPRPLDVAEVRWALGDLIMITQSEQEREWYESRLRMQRDVYTAIAEAREEGLAEGRTEGRAEGRTECRAEGRTEGRAEGGREGQIAQIQLFERLLRKDATPRQHLESLPLEDLESLANRLEAELKKHLGDAS